MASKVKSQSVSTAHFRRDIDQFLMQVANGQQIRVKLNGKIHVEILNEKKVKELRRRARLNPKIREWFESWQETQDILSDPVMMDGIRRSEEDIKAGRLLTLDQLKARLGFDD